MTAPATRALTSREVCQRTGFTYRQLDYWIRRGVLTWDNADPGYGHHRHWPEPEVTKAAALSRMLAEGITAAKAAELLAAGRTARLTVEPLPETLP